MGRGVSTCVLQTHILFTGSHQEETARPGEGD